MSKLDVDLFLTLLAQEVDAHQIEGISIVQSKIKQLETQLGINTKALEEALDEIENQDAKIKQLEFDCEDFIKAAKIALEDRDKQVMKVRRLEDVINRALTIYDMDKLDDIIGSGHAMANILKKALGQK